MTMLRVITTTLLMAAALMAAALAACSSTAKVTAADPETVTVSYKPGKVKDANETARKFCNAYNRRAQFRSTHTEADGRLLGIYDCAPSTAASVPE
jgi:hypothetical protein